MTAKPDADKSTKPEDKADEQEPGNSQEEKAKAQDAKPARAAKAEAVVVKIDAENISQRILALPIPARNYGQLVAGKAGTIFLLEEPSRPGPEQQTRSLSL